MLSVAVHTQFVQLKRSRWGSWEKQWKIPSSPVALHPTAFSQFSPTFSVCRCIRRNVTIANLAVGSALPPTAIWGRGPGSA